MEGYYVGQLILVGVLVLITGYYAVQTRRHANLVQRQLEENRRIREEDIDQDHKRRALNEIREWAKEGILIFSDFQRLHFVDQDQALFTRLANIFVEKEAMVTAAQEFGSDFKEKVETTADDLKDYFSHFGEGHYKFSGVKTKKAERSFKDDASNCRHSFFMLSGTVADVKAELKI